MLGKPSPQNQRDMFQPHLRDIINMSHELVLLAETIDWKTLEDELSALYSSTGTPSMPVRTMVGLLLLKHLFNLGDETLEKWWVMNPYMQYFCGESSFKHKFPCDPSDLVHFRHRLGEEGMSKVFAMTVKLHGKRARGKMVLSDTTVQENNTEFPTDARLAKKVIDKCNSIAKEEGIQQRQSYKRVGKQLVRQTHNSNHPKRKKTAKKASRRLKTLAGRQVRELGRKLSTEALEKHVNELEIMGRVISQQRHDKDKVYSLHKPYTACIAKGKAHKPYEFGNKVGLMVHPESLVVTAVMTFKGNPHDSTTIGPLLDQQHGLTGFKAREVVYDRGGKGKREIGGTKISTPSKPAAKDSPYRRSVNKKKFRRRAAIDPVIGHLKSDHRMQTNYLSGEESPQINAFLACAAWNLKKWMAHSRNKAKKALFDLLGRLFGAPLYSYYNQYPSIPLYALVGAR